MKIDEAPLAFSAPIGFLCIPAFWLDFIVRDGIDCPRCWPIKYSRKSRPRFMVVNGHGGAVVYAEMTSKFFAFPRGGRFKTYDAHLALDDHGFPFFNSFGVAQTVFE